MSTDTVFEVTVRVQGQSEPIQTKFKNMTPVVALKKILAHKLGKTSDDVEILFDGVELQEGKVLQDYLSDAHSNLDLKFKDEDEEEEEVQPSGGMPGMGMPGMGMPGMGMPGMGMPGMPPGMMGGMNPNMMQQMMGGMGGPGGMPDLSKMMQGMGGPGGMPDLSKMMQGMGGPGGMPDLSAMMKGMGGGMPGMPPGLNIQDMLKSPQVQEMMESPNFQNMVNSMMPADKKLPPGGIKEVMKQMQEHPDLEGLLNKQDEEESAPVSAPPVEQPKAIESKKSEVAAKQESSEVPKQLLKDLESLKKHFESESQQKGPRLGAPNDQPVTQMGVYLKDLADLLDAFGPHLRRTGELLINNSQLKEADRKAVGEMSVHAGEVLEAISVASGSVGHLFRGVEFKEGARPKVQPADPKAHLKEIVAIGKRTHAQKEKKAEPADDDTPNFMTRCAATFNITEMLALIKGDFGKIDKFVPRIRQILKDDIQTSNKTRQEYAKQAVDALRGSLKVPAELQPKLAPGFEPQQGICEILSIHLPALLAIVLDTQGSDDEVLAKGKEWGDNFIFALYDEMHEGFDDLQAMKDTLKGFVNLLIKASIDPAKAGIAQMIAVPHIMKYVEANLNQKAGIDPDAPAGENNAPKAEAKKAETPKPVAAAAVAEETKVAETLQQKYARLLQKNQVAMSQSRPRPHSRAYDSLNLNKNATTAEEEAMNQQSYQSDKSALALSKSAFVHKSLRKALIDSGIFSTNDANQKMKSIDEETGIPEGVKKAYFNMMNVVTEQRLTNDTDFTPGRYQYSDQFLKNLKK